MQHTVWLNRIQVHEGIAFPMPHPFGGSHAAPRTQGHRLVTLGNTFGGRRDRLTNRHAEQNHDQRRLHGRPDNAFERHAGCPDHRQLRGTGHGAQADKATHEGTKRQVIVDSPGQGQRHIPQRLQGLIFVARVFQFSNECKDHIQRQHHNHNQEHGAANGTHDITIDLMHAGAPPSQDDDGSATRGQTAATGRAPGTAHAPRAYPPIQAPFHPPAHPAPQSVSPDR